MRVFCVQFAVVTVSHEHEQNAVAVPVVFFGGH